MERAAWRVWSVGGKEEADTYIHVGKQHPSPVG